MYELEQRNKTKAKKKFKFISFIPVQEGRFLSLDLQRRLEDRVGEWANPESRGCAKVVNNGITVP